MQLAAFVATGDALLSVLPPKIERNADQEDEATAIHAICRTARRDFLAAHCEWLYGRLTHGFTVYKRIEDLAREAALVCPGLLPSSDQMKAERTLRQSEKEGREGDQGLFFHALLSRPTIANHLLTAMQLPTKRAHELLPAFQRTGKVIMRAVTIERRQAAAHITITNAHCLNAEDLPHVEDMETAVDLALLDETVSVCVLRGGEMDHPRYTGRRVFSAGVNLKELDAGRIPFVEFFLGRELGYLNKMVRGLIRPTGDTGPGLSEKPWLAIVDTFAIGGGAQILLACDWVIAAADSYASLPAAQEGIVPGFANLRLSRFLGRRLAQHVILGGRSIRATDPEASLLFSQVVPPADLDAAIEQTISKLASPSVVANRRMLNLTDEPLEDFIRYAAEFALVQSGRIYGRDVLDKIGAAAARASRTSNHA